MHPRCTPRWLQTGQHGGEYQEYQSDASKSYWYGHL
jgi:hypothetical protein